VGVEVGGKVGATVATLESRHLLSMKVQPLLLYPFPVFCQSS
jgi:hypothetical protein